ncbi:hypothetical protein CYMTET_44451 [Cymbomonas tetramitiformis]|uniref:SWIM-type domain-containing protein n=1 Tax=Cymbomonas tetramitiformis TaxID=36881 RepID=A0AAE0C1E6_9CHLO|nr:hypothetical protein CYMTET_44451 [Cymbomonas tetramitiformis]
MPRFSRTQQRPRETTSSGSPQATRVTRSTAPTASAASQDAEHVPQTSNVADQQQQHSTDTPEASFTLAVSLPSLDDLEKLDSLKAEQTGFLSAGDIQYYPDIGFCFVERVARGGRILTKCFQIIPDTITGGETLRVPRVIEELSCDPALKFTGLNTGLFTDSKQICSPDVPADSIRTFPAGISQEGDVEEESAEAETSATDTTGYAARRREQKRLCAQRRRALLKEVSAQPTNPDNIRPPRVLRTLKATLLADIISKDQIVRDRDTALLLTAEVQEREGKLAQLGKVVHQGLGKRCQNSPDHVLAACGVSSTCTHCVEWRPVVGKDASSGAWRCVDFQPHTCVDLNQVEHRTQTTAYTPAQLAPIAAHKLVENPEYSVLNLKADLQPYLSLAPPRSLLQSVLTVARGKLAGDPSGELAKLPVLAQLLREQGHACEVHTLGATEMHDVLVDIEHKEFLQEQKQRPAGQRERWNRNMASKYPVEEGRTYCVGWSFSPCTTIATVDCFIPVSYGDGAHMRSNAAGILMSTVTRDAQHHVVPITYSCFLMNESEVSHGMQLLFSNGTYGDKYDQADRREISDKDKGLAAAWEKNMRHAKLFTCARHRGDTVSTTVKPGGSEARALFDQAVKALTIPKLEAIKARYSTRAAEFLGKATDESQYMAACGKLHGESVNSSVESMNAANDAVRKEFKEGVHMTKALLTTVKLTERRYNTNKAEAQRATSEMPPALIRDLAEALDKATEITSGISFTASDKVVARIESTVTPGVSYISTLRAGEPAECDCGWPKLHGLPCHHNLAHARVTGRKWEDYVDVMKTTAQWKKQYPVHLVFPPHPNLTDCEAHPLYDPRLLLPPAAAKRKGRPQKQARKKGILERGLVIVSTGS